MHNTPLQNHAKLLRDLEIERLDSGVNELVVMRQASVMGQRTSLAKAQYP